MGTIETTYDLTKDLTIVKAAGKMKAGDFQDWRANYYKGTVTKIRINTKSHRNRKGGAIRPAAKGGKVGLLVNLSPSGVYPEDR